MTCLFGSAAYADFSYDFSTPPPATFVYSGVPRTGPPSATFSSSVSGGVLRLGDSRHPNSGGSEQFQTDAYWRDHILFYEYFHGDNGAGLGASHQTGRTR